MTAKLKKYFIILYVFISIIFCIGVSVPAVAGSCESDYMTGDSTPEERITDTDGYSCTEFDCVLDWVASLVESPFGHVVAGALVLAGIVAGTAKQSLKTFVVYIFAALGLVYAPSIIKSVFSGDVQGTADAIQIAFDSISNHAEMATQTIDNIQ